MKIMKGKMIATAIVTATAFLVSCSEETGLVEDNALPKAELNETTKAQFASLGFDNVRVANYPNAIEGTDDEVFVIDEDIIMTVKQLQEMLKDEEGKILDLGTEQYRTSALVNNNRTYSVIGYTGSCCALTSKMRTGLQWAVNNYNRLNGVGIRFSLSFSAGTNADMVVYNNGQGGGGGSAGFPSGGRPNKFIQINAGTDGFSTNVNEHVITHEMGHSVGFRHTDYFNRSLSCSSGGNEGTAGVGAILIPGTPSGTDRNSIMQACFSNNEDGEFGPNDITALQFMY